MSRAQQCATVNPRLRCRRLCRGALVALTGHWQRSPPDKEQEKELRVEEVSVIGPTDAEVCIQLICGPPPSISSRADGSQRYPLPKKIHGTDFLRTIPHLRLRTPLHALLARLRSECDYHLASYFRDHGFIRLQPPIITSSDCEGAGEVFTVSQNVAANNIDGKDDSPTQGAGHFFRESKYLTVSSQLHLEAYMSEHAKVWTLSPTFRAEKSDTSRHLSEFWMLEVEFRTESLSEVISQVEDMLKMLVKNLWTTCVVQEMLTLKRRDGIEDIEAGKEAASLISRRWAELAERPWPRITYSEAIDELEYAARSGTAQFQHRPSWCGGLQLEHERHIATTFGKGSPVFVTHYPQKIKPFYMLPTSTSSSYPSDQQATAACFDLLLPDGCEVVGGSLREHRLHHLSHAMRRIGLNAAEPKHDSSNADISPSTNSGNMEWYIDLRRYGSVPHGGFGLGFDRLLGYLAGIASIKDVVPWPRYFGRCDC